MITVKARFGLMFAAVAMLVLSLACEHTAVPTLSDLEIAQDYSYITSPAARWQAYGLKNHAIQQKRLCFCGFPHGFVRLIVNDSKIVAGIDLTSGQAVPVSTLQYYQTIDDLFVWIEATQAVNPAHFEIEYDSRFGYPKKIALDFSFGVADDELWIEMQSLKKIQE